VTIGSYRNGHQKTAATQKIILKYKIYTNQALEPFEFISIGECVVDTIGKSSNELSKLSLN